MDNKISVECARNGWIARKKITDYDDIYVFVEFDDLVKFLRDALAFSIPNPNE